MAAIITSKFRLDATNKFVNSLTDNQFYMALGRPNEWTNEASAPAPIENDYTNSTLWENMFAMKRIDATDIVHSAPRNLWVAGTTYAEYDDQDSNIENKVYFVISDNNNVYMCLKAGGAASTVNPDILGVVTTGVHDTGSDGYIWKYMFSVPTADVTKFLTSSFLPVRKVKTDPVSGSDLALENQWLVQESAVDGAIYNMKVTAGGSGYADNDTFTITITGDGANAEILDAGVTVTSGVITGLTMNNVGTGYTQATVVITSNGSGSGATARPVIGPIGGFGYDPTNDLRSHYVTINKAFTGDESGTIIDSNDFRQISIIKNPIKSGVTANKAIIDTDSMVEGQFYKILDLGTTSDAEWITAGTSASPHVGEIFKALLTTITGNTTGTIAGVAEGNAYNTCKRLDVSLSVNETTDGNTFTDDMIVEGHKSGDNGLLRAKGQVVEWDNTNGILWYTQNETTGYGTFLETHFVRDDDDEVNEGQDITDVIAPLIIHNSGDVMFIENRIATTRGTDQVETVRLVIAF